jgi:chitin deacetylase
LALTWPRRGSEFEFRREVPVPSESDVDTFQSPRSLLLTFDDGPGPSTERLLDVLAAHGARATFFVLGRNLLGEALGGDGARALSIAARAVCEGHALGNHTMTHSAELPSEALLNEVEECDLLIQSAYAQAGRPLPAIPVRLPFGPYRRNGMDSAEALERLGRPHWHWSGDPQDWRPGRTAAEIFASAMGHLEREWGRDGVPVLLLHDSCEGPRASDDLSGGSRDATIAAVAALCAHLAPLAVQYRTAHDGAPLNSRIRIPRRT